MNIYFCVYKVKRADLGYDESFDFKLYSNIIQNFKNYLFS